MSKSKKPSKPDVARKRTTISVDESLLEWADHMVESGFKYKDRSHVFEYALALLKEREESKE